MASPGYSDSEKKEDMKVLHGKGYAQELRSLDSKFFELRHLLLDHLHSFGRHQLLRPGDRFGRRRRGGIGWIVGCALSGMFALAMAQIASAFPTAGGLYHWGSILGTAFVGWLTAWLNLLGLITVLGAINIGTAYFFPGKFGAYFGTTGPDGR